MTLQILEAYVHARPAWLNDQQSPGRRCPALSSFKLAQEADESRAVVHITRADLEDVAKAVLIFAHPIDHRLHRRAVKIGRSVVGHEILHLLLRAGVAR